MEFVAVNQVQINRAIFDPDFVAANNGPTELQKVGGEFISQILSATLKKLDMGEIEDSGPTVYRFSADDEPTDFPYTDDSDLDAE